VRADEVVLINGDHVHGKVGTVAAGKLKLTSPVLGDLLIDLSNVKTYTTETAATVRLKNGDEVTGKIAAGDAGKVAIQGKDEIPTAQIKQINPPEQKWTGSVLVNGALARGNTHSETLGASLNAILRRDDAHFNDRFTLGAGYAFGRERNDNGVDSTTTDNWFLLGKYDDFFTTKLYGYGNVRLEHDRIADLFYRVTPGLGLGYQFIEGPTLNLNGEAGVSYVYEDFDHDGTNEHVAVRLAGHFDKKLHEKVTIFANGEYLPAFDDPGDYNLNADAGLRATLVKNFFAEFKIEWKRDSTPAPNAEKNDLRYLLGVGWNF
jgi:putative salt-induced outer membrane protein YdiY